MLGRVSGNVLELSEIHRFANEPVRIRDGLHWDILRIHHEVLQGLARAGRVAHDLVSAAVDSWGVDYGLLDASGALVGNPYHYRDERTNGVPDQVHARVSPSTLYERTGIQVMQINTIYQLASAAGTPQLDAARTLLLIPDLLVYWLTGAVGSEVTNASTTGLLDVESRTWADDVVVAAGIPAGLFPGLHGPGEVVGPLVPEAQEETGLPSSVVVTLVGSHDTASSVVGVPA